MNAGLPRSRELIEGGPAVLTHERFRGYLGLGFVWAAAVLMGAVELRHMQKMSTSVGIAVFAILPFLVNIGLFVGIYLAWRGRFDGHEILRIAGWVAVGSVALGLLATWTITHQNIRGRPFAHAPFVTVNNMSAGGMIGFLIGWYHTLNRRHRDAVEAERAKLEFLNRTLRHNLLNGLNVIHGNADLLADSVDESSQQQLARIRSRAEELTRFTEATRALMGNFLDHGETDFTELDLGAVLTREVEIAREDFDDAAFSSDLPGEMSVMGDEYVPELFRNLLGNAVQHNDKPVPEVSVTATERDGTYLVSVADNGPGIPDAEKDQVLEWNVRGTESAGSGLGLAIANTLADRYGGTLWIEDNEPTGTVVNVELPGVGPVESRGADSSGHARRELLTSRNP